MTATSKSAGLKAKLARFLPGIFLLGFNIGTGSVTTMATAGANYGMTLLWTVMISCAATYLMIATYGRYTLVTGETALEAFRKHIHPAVGMFFILMPPVADMAAGLVPSVPEVASSETGPLLLIASMVGTTIFSGLFIIRTTLVKEAGWTMEHDKQQRRDAAFAAIMMFVISASIMAAAAGSLFAEGIGLDRASQMIGLLEPLAGPLAVSIFAMVLSLRACLRNFRTC